MQDQQILRTERPEDSGAIRKVNQLAFGQDDEANLVEALRKGPKYNREMSIVAEVSGKIVGHILFTQLELIAKGAEVQVAGLAPMAVIPEKQRQGIGGKLIEEGLRRLGLLGYGAVFVLGHSDYYPRFGFRTNLAKKVNSVYSGDHFMALELRAGAIAGLENSQLLYPKAFDGI